MAFEKRKPFKGKKLHKDLRDYKNQEVKRSLVHRARLRKSYFKFLEKEGAPSGQEHDETGNDQEIGETEGSANLELELARDLDSSREVSDTQDSHTNLDSGHNNSNSDTPRTRHGARLPPQKDIPKTIEPVSKRKSLNFAERVKLAKQRKSQIKEEELQRVQERRQKIEQSHKERQRKKLSLSKRTKRGQPVMGPKISDLLEKIRHNS